MSTSVIGYGAVRNGVIQTGAVALLLGAALAASSSARAATTVERDENVARPAAPAVPPAPPVQAAPAQSRVAPAPPAPPAPSTTESRAELDAKLRDAQERMNRAASEVAALAAERAADAMEAFKSMGEWPRRTVIGVQISSDSENGTRVMDVSPGGPAEQAGVRAGDVIVMVNGEEVKGDAGRRAVRLLRDAKPDTHIKLRVLREGKPREFEVVARPMVAMNPFVFQSEPPPGVDGDAFRGAWGPNSYSFTLRSELTGLEVTTLTPQLGKYFGTSKGVLVVRAPKDDTYKLQDGDVILSIDGREPTSGSHITRILSSYQPGEQLTLRVMRDRKAQDIVVTTPDNRARTRDRTRTSWVDFGDPH